MFRVLARCVGFVRGMLGVFDSRPAGESPIVRFPARVGGRRLRRDRRPAHPASAISRPILRRHWLGGMW